VRHVTPRLIFRPRPLAKSVEALAPSCRVSVHEGDVVPFVLYVPRVKPGRKCLGVCLRVCVCVCVFLGQHGKCGLSLCATAGLCTSMETANGTERGHCTSTHAGWKAGRMGR
jgi:hypothetical protein